MKYGVCFDVAVEQNVKAAAESGYDYVEVGFQRLARGTAQQQRQIKENLKEYRLPALAANGFLPGDLKTNGTEKDNVKLADYINRGLEFGKPLGLEKVVFGSGGARSAAPGNTFAQAFRETAEFLGEIASPIFRDYGAYLVIEPLAPAEVDLVNTVKEAAMLAAASGADNVFVLADIYHMGLSGDAFANIHDIAPLLRHAHISYPTRYEDFTRIFMRDFSEYNYLGFLAAVRAAGCETCSVEASIIDIAVDAPAALKVLKRAEAVLDLID
ncbi:MAG: sugar phosphate isomerase/epimerase [Clostridia bacterium]|nr:sugar phosphate isomerase/epimerase [Clostridia bacterium]